MERLKSRFFANVSHELHTTLTLMLGPVNSLLKRKKKRDIQETMLLQFIQPNARQLQTLINEILDLSKLEADKLEVVEDPVHLLSYLNEQLAQFQSSDKLDLKLNIRRISRCNCCWTRQIREYRPQLPFQRRKVQPAR